MKVYVTGPVGSGKSTFSEQLSEILEIPVYHLDDVVYERAASGDRKRSDCEIEQIFQEILTQKNYIIEDVFRDKFSRAVKEVDKILYLDLPKQVIYLRIIKRFLKQKIGLEKINRKINSHELRLNFQWFAMFNKRKAEIEKLPQVVKLTNRKQVKSLIKNTERTKEL